MSEKTKIISLDASNLEKFGCPCFMNAKKEGHLLKLEWVRKRFAEGLRIKLLFIEGEKKNAGFIEYIPGENAWRAVSAPGYLFIHCLWISPNKNKRKGYGSLLIQDCLHDAEKENMLGVAVVTSEGSFMAGKDLFLQNGFKSVASAEPSYELMVAQLKKGSLPTFKDWQKQLAARKGFQLVYSRQCPWVAGTVSEYESISQAKNIDLMVTELKNATNAQKAPSIYSCCSLTLDGKLLSDHYISTTRFQNILKKEFKR